jgi:predicted deacylase
VIELQKHVVVGTTSGPHLLITGGVHGDEFEPMVTIRQLNSFVRSEHLSGKLTLVPVVNESAFALGRRTAEDNLDLARTCPGHSDGSITEQVAHAVGQLISTADYYIDLHTGGTAMCIMPFVGYMLHADSNILEQQRRMAHAFNLPIIWGTTPTLNGRTISVARDAGIPAIYAEYLGGGRCDSQGIKDYFDGCLNVMRELKMIERKEPASKVTCVIEDPREKSGHLQINHLAPFTGFFEPNVELGQKVTCGDLLGSVTDALGKRVHEIRSEKSGIVLCLTTFSRVLEGTGLAVVLEIPENKEVSH